MLYKYASKQVKLSWFTIFVALGSYKTNLQSHMAKK